jgi:hypothetical protein
MSMERMLAPVAISLGLRLDPFPEATQEGSGRVLAGPRLVIDGLAGEKGLGPASGAGLLSILMEMISRMQ